MLQPNYNYDTYQQYDLHRIMKNEEQQVKQMKQEVIKTSLEEQRRQQDEKKRQELENQQKQDFDQISLIQKLNKEVESQKKQNKFLTQQNLSLKYSEIISQQKNIEDEKRKEGLNIENVMLNNAQQGLSLDRQVLQQKKILQRQIYEQQMKEVEEKRQRQKLQRDYDKIMFQEQAQKEEQRVKQNEDDYHKYYQKLSQRNDQLQEIYRKSVDDPRQQLDFIIDRQVKERLEKEQQEIKTRRQNEQTLKEQYQSTLAYQLQEKDQRKKISEQAIQQNQQEIRLAASMFEEEQKQDKRKKKEFLSQYYGDVAQVGQSDDRFGQKTELSQSQAYNPLTNPNPNQIQNPYILRQLGINYSNHASSPLLAKSKLATLGQNSLIN